MKRTVSRLCSADGWSKPHPYGIDGAYFAQRTPRSTQWVGGVMTPPYDGPWEKQQFIELFRSRGARCASIARVRNEIGRGPCPPVIVTETKMSRKKHRPCPLEIRDKGDE